MNTRRTAIPHVTECVHEHTAECYPAESVSENTATPSEPEEAEPTECTHECSEESDCITKALACKHEHKVNGGLGRDEACGYVHATEGTPCTYVCEICNAQDNGTRLLRPTHSRKNVPVKPSVPRKKSMRVASSALRRV